LKIKKNLEKEKNNDNNENNDVDPTIVEFIGFTSFGSSKK
jgi:hypothetical protein